ncbi:hypothetical protein AGMMS50276_21400 [Synergistales bacterium]|nr:hypothetical protein AGMMS50276_21400 [Synergistales bacterium]
MKKTNEIFMFFCVLFSALFLGASANCAFGASLNITALGAEKPIELKGIDIQGEIVGHLARTTVDMTFYNPNARVLEGELQFPLFDGQTVTGFALEMGEGKTAALRNAVPVEKAKGRQTFEAITRQNIDPALLEVTQGDNFKMRVYPLNPGGTRRVRVTIDERLSDSADSSLYRLPLFASKKIEKFNLSLRLPGLNKAPKAKSASSLSLSFKNENGAFVVSATQENISLQPYDAGGSYILELSIPKKPNETSVVLGEREGKTYFYADIPIEPQKNLRPLPSAISILWDASASRKKAAHTKELAFLEAFFNAQKNASVHLQVIRDVSDVTKVFDIKDGDWSELRQTLQSAVYDGATNLGSFTALPTSADSAIFMFSDGLDNYSATPLSAHGIPLFAFISEVGADTSRLKSLSRNGGAVIDLLTSSAEAALKEITNASPQIHVEGDGVGELLWRLSSSSVLSVVGVINSDATLKIRVDGVTSDKKIPIDIQNLPRSSQVPFLWASIKIEELEAESTLNKGEIRRIGKSFGLASGETSLIVLDRVEDYVLYDIEPPAELKKEYDRLRTHSRPRTSEPLKLERVAREWQEREKWWKKDFPKGEKKTPNNKRPNKGARIFEDGVAERFEMAATPMTTGAVALPYADVNAKLDGRQSEEAPIGAPETSAVIALRPWTPDEPYIKRMRDAAPQDLYRIYLDERADYENSVAFYLDVSYQLRDQGQEALSLRVLSNLAEMNLENRQILRVLGKRLIEAEKFEQAVVIFKKVLSLGEEEPQSYRDLGLAYAAAGKPQLAIDYLYDVVEKNFARAFPGIEIIALTEMNAIIANSPDKLDKRRIDSRFLSNLPLDLRITLTWDTDDTDIDLHIIDPNGEEAFYRHPLSYQGGRVSPDNTSGYGPEEYSIKTAKPGIYRAEVNFYGHRQQLLSDSTTIQLDFFTRYGTPSQAKQSVTMRLRDAKDRIVVGEFQVK